MFINNENIFVGATRDIGSVRGSMSSTRASAIPCWSLGSGTLLALRCHSGVTDLIYNRLTKSSSNSLKMTVFSTLLPGLPAYPQLCTGVPSQHCSHRYNGLTDPDWPPCPTPPSRPGGRDPAHFLSGPGILPSSWYIMDSKITVDKSVPRSKLCQEEFSENMRTQSLSEGRHTNAQVISFEGFSILNKLHRDGANSSAHAEGSDFLVTQPSLIKRDYIYISTRDEILYLE